MVKIADISSKQPKKAKRNTKSKSMPKNAYQWEDYLNTISLKMEPANDSFVERLALKLITWVRECDDALTLNQFYNIVGVDQKTFNRWMHKSKILLTAHDTALSIICDRREMKLKDDLMHLRFMHPQYSDICLTEHERRAAEKESLGMKLSGSMRSLTDDDLRVA